MYKNAYVRAGRNGGWRAVIVHEDGSRTTKALKASSRRDAKKSLDEMLANGGPAKRGHPVGVLAKSLVDDLDAVGSVEKSTIKDYRQSQRRIERAFQGIDVEDLDRDACQRWERRLVQDGYSPTVVIKAHRLMKRVCKKAVGDGLIAKNPMEFVVPPKYKKVKPGINYLDRRERGRLLDKLAKEPAGRLHRPEGGGDMRPAMERLRPSGARPVGQEGNRRGRAGGIREGDEEREQEGCRSSGRPCGGTRCVAKGNDREIHPRREQAGVGELHIPRLARLGREAWDNGL